MNIARFLKLESVALYAQQLRVVVGMFCLIVAVIIVVTAFILFALATGTLFVIETIFNK